MAGGGKVRICDENLKDVAQVENGRLLVQTQTSGGGPAADVNINAVGGVAIGATVPVSGTVAVTQSTSPWVIGDGGGSITIDGTVAVSSLAGNVTVVQATHDNLNANANMQIGDVDVGAANPVPISDNGGAITVDGTVAISAVAGNVTVVQATHDNLNCNANVQQGDADVAAANALFVQPGTGAAFPVTDNGGSITVDGAVTVSGTVAVTQSTSPWVVSGTATVMQGTDPWNVGGTVSAIQVSHDDLNCNANLQLSNTDVSPANPVPITDGGTPIDVTGSVLVESVAPGTSALQLGKAEDDPAASADVGVMVLAVRQDALSNSVSANGDYGTFKIDSIGALWVRNADVTTAILSGSSNGRPIQITATASTGTTIHTASTTNLQRIYIDLTNTSANPVIVTIEFGTTGVGAEIDITVPPNDTVRAVDGWVIGAAASQVIRAYAGTGSVCNATGRVETIN